MTWLAGKLLIGNFNCSYGLAPSLAFLCEANERAVPLYLWLSARSRILLEKLIVFQVVKKCPAFYVIRMISNMFKTVRHWFLSLGIWI
jgi:hypothetical protein